jgi:hypothetical protein
MAQFWAGAASRKVAGAISEAKRLKNPGEAAQESQELVRWAVHKDANRRKGPWKAPGRKANLPVYNPKLAKAPKNPQRVVVPPSLRRTGKVVDQKT